MDMDIGDPEMARHGLYPQRASSLVLVTDSWATFMAGLGWSIPCPKRHIGDSRNARSGDHIHCAELRTMCSSCSLGPALPHDSTQLLL